VSLTIVPGTVVAAESTTAVHTVLVRPTIFFIQGMDHDLVATASCGVLPDVDVSAVRYLETTSSGSEYELGKDRPAGDHVHELRRMSGLTWEQLASVFGVTRRTIHLWASGKPMNIKHETTLHRLRAFVYSVDRGEAHLNRAELLSVTPSGECVLDLLKDGRFDMARMFVGRGATRPDRKPHTPLSPESRAAREPQHPVEVIDTHQDVVHRESGRLVRALSRRLKRPT